MPPQRVGAVCVLLLVARVHQTELSRELIRVLLQHKIDAFTNKDGNWHLGPVVQDMQRLVLLGCDVHRCGDFLARHVLIPKLTAKDSQSAGFVGE